MKRDWQIILMILGMALLLFAGGCSESWEKMNKAAQTGDVETIKEMLDNGKDPDLRDPSGATPLINASARGKTDVVRLLIERGANVDASDNGGFRPIHGAVGAGHVEIARMLKEAGADLDVPFRGMLAVQVAERKGNPEMMALFRKPGEEAGEIPGEGEAAIPAVPDEEPEAAEPPGSSSAADATDMSGEEMPEASDSPPASTEQEER